MGNRWKQCQTIFFGSKITSDGDYSHEIKRCLLLGSKVMTNLDSILKSRDITLSTKVHLVKVMVFPVVMYGCESWTIKKAKRRRIDAFELWCWRRLLRVPGTAQRSNQSILREISPACALEGLMLKLKLQYFGHLMGRADSFEKSLMLGKIEGRTRRGRQRMRWLAGITDEFGKTLGAGDGQGGLACCGSWGLRVGHDWATELHWNACVHAQLLSHVQLLQWTVANQSFLFMEFSRQGSGLPLPTPGNLLDPGIECMSLVLKGRFLITAPTGKPYYYCHGVQ